MTFNPSLNFIADVAEGMGANALADKYGFTAQAVRAAAKAFGLELRDKRKTATYYDEAVRLRETGLTLEEIGNRFGVTRERIRQVLKIKNCDYRRPVKVNEGVCKNCGTALAGKPLVAIYCSRGCWLTHTRKTLTDRESEIIRTVILARTETPPATWQETSARLSPPFKSFTGLHSYFRLCCAKVGIDHNIAFTSLRCAPA